MKSDTLYVILSSPSGAGKSTISRMLLDKCSDFGLSISNTTRKPRDGEIEGQHYYFTPEDAFKQSIIDENFLEYAKVHGNYYGTKNSEVEKIVKSGHDPLFDIDWQGANSIRKQLDYNHILSIFILPPSLTELQRRLEARAKDSTEVIQKRMDVAIEEIKHYQEYDYVFINDNLQDTFNTIWNVYLQKKNDLRQKNTIRTFVNKLLAD